MSQFFSVRKSAMETKLYCALIILSMGLGWAKENFGTQCPKNICLKMAEKEKSTTFGRSVLGRGAWFKFGTVSQLVLNFNSKEMSTHEVPSIKFDSWGPEQYKGKKDENTETIISNACRGVLKRIYKMGHCPVFWSGLWGTVSQNLKANTQCS